MKSIKGITLLILVSSLLFAGCAPVKQISATDLQTLVAQTVEAMKTDIALQPTQTMVVPTVPTAAELPTFTPIPTLNPTATSIPPTPTAKASLVVGSVESLTIPDGTTLKGGQTFVKKWRITNGGTAAWNKDYRIVFVSGDNLGISSITLGRVVNPGSSFDVSVTFTAPVNSGAHVSNFMMATESDYKFGLGASSGTPWAVRITVEKVFYVTAASVAANPTSYTGACPATINLTPTISANGSGLVTYYLRTSSGVSDTFSMNFTDSGSIVGANVSWPIDSSMTSLTVNVYIDAPNHQDFGTVTIPITCTP